MIEPISVGTLAFLAARTLPHAIRTIQSEWNARKQTTLDVGERFQTERRFLKISKNDKEWKDLF